MDQSRGVSPILSCAHVLTVSCADNHVEAAREDGSVCGSAVRNASRRVSRHLITHH